MRRAFARHSGFLVAGLAVAAILAAPLAAAGGTVLSLLDRGQWEIRFRDNGATRRVCLRDGQEFIRLQHKGEECRNFVVNDDPARITVHYTCNGAGYGQTTITRETSRLVQIRSQGIAQGLPFEFLAEARHVGKCR